MEKIIKNPGLQHLAEDIFLNLNYSDLNKCQLINQSTSQILDNPMFWIRELIQKGLSKENQNDWIEAIQLNYEKKKYIAAYLKWNLKEKNLFNFPCFTKPVVQENFRSKLVKICSPFKSSIENTEIVKILAPLTDNPNGPNYSGLTPIYMAASDGHTEIVKILAPWTNNPNAPYNNGWTPIYWAARNVHTEIIKILAPLTGNPNVPDKDGYTPIYWAARNGHTEIFKILAPFCQKISILQTCMERPHFIGEQNLGIQKWRLQY